MSRMTVPIFSLSSYDAALWFHRARFAFRAISLLFAFGRDFERAKAPSFPALDFTGDLLGNSPVAICTTRYAAVFTSIASPEVSDDLDAIPHQKVPRG
jgi:hypothetical protein